MAVVESQHSTGWEERGDRGVLQQLSVGEGQRRRAASTAHSAVKQGNHILHAGASWVLAGVPGVV